MGHIHCNRHCGKHFYALFCFILTISEVGIITIPNSKEVRFREVEVTCQRFIRPVCGRSRILVQSCGKLSLSSLTLRKPRNFLGFSLPSAFCSRHTSLMKYL